MLDGLVAWLTEANGRISFHVVPVETADDGFPWVEAIAAGLSTIGSAIVALLILWLTKRGEIKRREDDERKAEAAMALATYSKISRYEDIINTVKSVIDGGKERAISLGLKTSSPSQMVGPIAGKHVEPERLMSKEYSFLFTKDNYKIIYKIENLESSAIQMISLVDEYNKRHHDLQNWIDNAPGVVRDFNGGVARDSIPTSLKGNIEFKFAQLDVLLEGVMLVTHGTDTDPVEVVREFIGAARGSSFKDHFPKLEYGI